MGIPKELRKLRCWEGTTEETTAPWKEQRWVHRWEMTTEHRKAQRRERNWHSVPGSIGLFPNGGERSYFYGYPEQQH
jgi:hypothetical protein